MYLTGPPNEGFSLVAPTSGGISPSGPLLAFGLAQLTPTATAHTAATWPGRGQGSVLCVPQLRQVPWQSGSSVSRPGFQGLTLCLPTLATLQGAAASGLIGALLALRPRPIPQEQALQE